MSRLIILYAILFLSIHSVIGSEDPVKDFYCVDKIETLLRDFKVKEKSRWKIHLLSSADGGRPTVYKRETSRFAHWVFLTKEEERETISLSSPYQSIVVSLSPQQKCKIVSRFIQQNVSQVAAKKIDHGFNDKDLFSFLRKNKKSIIALWSPGMGHSGSSIERLRKVAKSLDVEILFLMDPNIPLEDGKRFLAERKINDIEVVLMNSNDLALRDGLIHFPSFFVANHYGISSPILPGLMTVEQYRIAVKDYLKP